MSNSYEVWRISYQNSEQAARAAFVEIESLRQQLAEARAGRVPEGYAIVPVEPTNEQWDAAWSAFGATSMEDLHRKLSIHDIKRLYAMFHSAMIKAAPQSPAGGVVLDEREAGIKAAVKFIETKAENYAQEFGHDDMGGLSFGSGPSAEIRNDYYNSLLELADELRGLAAQPQQEVGRGDN